MQYKSTASMVIARGISTDLNTDIQLSSHHHQNTLSYDHSIAPRGLLEVIQKNRLASWLEDEEEGVAQTV